MSESAERRLMILTITCGLNSLSILALAVAVIVNAVTR